MKQILFITLSLLIANKVPAQLNQNNTCWMEYLEELSESETEVSSIEHLFNDLSYLAENPFNLHTVTKSDLERLPFLSESQVEELLYYIYKNAPLLSLYELKNVEGFDMQTITYLLPFIYIGEEQKKQSGLSPQRVMKYGKQELLLRSDFSFQEKAGYKNVTDREREEHPDNYYLGEPYYLSFKYGFQYKDRIQFGIAGEKDAGEPFWNRHHKGFNYYSFHFALKNTGLLQALYLGDYRLSFGQGLVVNTDFTVGKTSDVLNVSKKASGVKRHFSTNEADYFRGIAAVFGTNDMKLSIFGSHRYLDANTDSSTIKTFKTDGYNRTVKDLEKHNRVIVNLAGANFQWRNESLELGLSGVYYTFGGKHLNPDQKPYNVYYLRGMDNFNVGINYGLKKKKISFRGETAVSKNGALATVNTLQLNPASFIGFTMVYRNYTERYQAQYARSFSEASSVQNESGFYLGTHLKISKYWELKSYLDILKFSWLKYGTDSPSEAHDVLLQLSYKPTANLNIHCRYKFKEKQRNKIVENLVSPLILPYKQHRLRCWVNFQISKSLDFKSQFDYNRYIDTNTAKSKGWMISQLIGYNPPNLPVKLDLGFAYFCTDDWNTGINNYEKNILYVFTSPVFYDEGIRYYVVLKIDIMKNLAIYSKVASTYYTNKYKISSGAEEIEGKYKTDAYCLVRLRF